MSFNRYITCALIVLMAAACVLAQSSGFGAISGTVTDQTGAVVAGAKVTVVNPSKGIHLDLESSSGGVFVVPNLIPASGYTVTVSHSGFTDYTVKDITVTVGQTVTLSPTLNVGAAGTSVEVTGQAPLIDMAKTSVSGVVGSAQVLNLPMFGRRVDQFVMLQPGVTNDGQFGLLTFRGNPGGNVFLTDGVDTTNSYYGENAGRSRAYNISQDSVQEFEVVSSNYSAEFGKASGGIVNTVTRSGTNTYHGSAYDFFNNRTLNAIDATTKNGLAPHGINPPSWRHQAGVSIGGPIMKDKLFFFYNGEIQRRSQALVSANLNSGAGNNLFNGDGTFKTGQDCVVGGANINLPSGAKRASGPTAAQCTAARAYIVSRVVPQLVPRQIDNNTSFGKLDWHPTDRDSISLSMNYVDFRSTNNIQTQLSKPDGSALGNNANSNVFDRTERASWTRVVTPTSINEFRFGAFHDKQEDPGSSQLIPTFTSAFGPTPTALTVNSVSNLGFARNYPRVNPSEQRYEVTDNFTWTKGKHNLKFGANLTHQEDFGITMLNEWPLYSYRATSNGSGGVGANSMTLLAMDIDGNVAPGQQAWDSFSQTVGNRVIDLNLWETSIYAQDDWHLTPKLTLSPGVRYEYSTVPQPANCNKDPRFAASCHIPTNSGYVAPRVGFSYAIFDKTVIRGGYGIFNSRYITSALENLNVANGVYQVAYSFGAAPSGGNPTPVGCLPSFPAVLPGDWTPSGTCNRALNPAVTWAAPNFRPSYSQQANLAIEREVAKNTTLSLSYVWSRSLHIQVNRDDNALLGPNPLTYRILDSTGAVVNTFTTPIYNKRNPIYKNSDGSFYSGSVSILESAANSYYNGLLVSLKHRYSDWFEGNVSYTWSHTIDYGVGFAPTFGSNFPSSFYNGNYRADKGSSQLDRRHNLIINAIFTPKFMHNDSALAKYVVNGWQLSTVNTLASSQAVAPTVSGASLSSALSTALGGGFYSSFSIDGLGGSSRVPFQSTSALNIAPLYRTDVRLTKTFPITERVKVQAAMEVYNLLNHLIITGRDKAEYTTTFPTSGPNVGYGVLTPRSSYGALTDTIGLSVSDGTSARRAQAILRINF